MTPFAQLTFALAPLLYILLCLDLRITCVEGPCCLFSYPICLCSYLPLTVEPGRVDECNQSRLVPDDNLHKALLSVEDSTVGNETMYGVFVLDLDQLPPPTRYRYTYLRYFGMTPGIGRIRKILAKPVSCKANALEDQFHLHVALLFHLNCTVCSELVEKVRSSFELFPIADFYNEQFFQSRALLRSEYRVKVRSFTLKIPKWSTSETDMNKPVAFAPPVLVDNPIRIGVLRYNLTEAQVTLESIKNSSTTCELFEEWNLKPSNVARVKEVVSLLRVACEERKMSIQIFASNFSDQLTELADYCRAEWSPSLVQELRSKALLSYFMEFVQEAFRSSLMLNYATKAVLKGKLYWMSEMLRRDVKIETKESEQIKLSDMEMFVEGYATQY
ncbi:unnamed protein product, partial [Protopolystoma xenopodis]